MKIALTGPTGAVGSAVTAVLLARGHEVVCLGRRPSPLPGARHVAYDLGGDVPTLAGMDAVVHLALSHLPGRYRGGQGVDPDGFVRLNRDGSVRLFEAADRAGVSRLVFLSSRAVYGAYSPGTQLTEELPPRPDTLYGKVKLEAEAALAALAEPDRAWSSLRATGIYGPPVPGQAHKWAVLLAAFSTGETPAPRIATEVHADDVAAAVLLLLETPSGRLRHRVWNVSDIVLDRRELLRRYAQRTGITTGLPAASDPSGVSAMTTDRLRALGWRPRGMAGLDAVLDALATECRDEGAEGARAR